MWKVLWKTLIWENQHLSLTTSIWVALNRSAKSEDIVDNYKNMFESRISAGATEKYLVWRDLMQTSLHGPMMWKVMQTVRSGIASWLTKQRRIWNLLENCQKYALTLSWNARIWHTLVDQTFYGQWTNLQDRLRNGPELVTNDYLVWSLSFFIHVNTNSIAMWETLPNNADCDCFKTLILLEILKTQNRLREEFCAYLEVIHLFPQVGCVRHKLQSHTVRRNLKLFLLMQDYAWMEFPLLIFGIWSLKRCTLPPTKQSDRKRSAEKRAA